MLPDEDIFVNYSQEYSFQQPYYAVRVVRCGDTQVEPRPLDLPTYRADWRDWHLQTFLPYADFELSAMCLDYRRLGKQRVEAFQILRCLAGHTSGWSNHPAVKMWEGHVNHLCRYYNAMLDEWEWRGYQNNMQYFEIGNFPNDYVPVDKSQRFNSNVAYAGTYSHMDWGDWPPWLGCPLLHNSHKSRLLAKDPVWYGQFGWDVPDDMPYWWPR